MPPSAKLLAFVIATSLVSWSIVARVHVLPWLDRKTRREVLLILLAPQMFRTVGALALFPGIGDPPREWAEPLAWGDCATAVLAMASMLALHRGWAHAAKLAWTCSGFGVLDLLRNAFEAVHLQVAPRIGPIAYVVGFGVPLMLVAHVLAIRTLLRRGD